MQGPLLTRRAAAYAALRRQRPRGCFGILTVRTGRRYSSKSTALKASQAYPVAFAQAVADFTVAGRSRGPARWVAVQGPLLTRRAAVRRHGHPYLVRPSEKRSEYHPWRREGPCDHAGHMQGSRPRAHTLPGSGISCGRARKWSEPARSRRQRCLTILFSGPCHACNDLLAMSSLRLCYCSFLLFDSVFWFSSAFPFPVSSLCLRTNMQPRLRFYDDFLLILSHFLSFSLLNNPGSAYPGFSYVN